MTMLLPFPVYLLRFSFSIVGMENLLKDYEDTTNNYSNECTNLYKVYILAISIAAKRLRNALYIESRDSYIASYS